MSTATTDTSKTALVFFHAQTPLHPGSGTALGVVDLPVQRERHTQWPTIPGSSIKGVFRDACRGRAPNGACTAVFGPETAEADKHAGALSVTDARILAFPVRSVRGVFAYATSRAVLQRLRRDTALTGDPADIPIPPPPAEGAAYCATDSPLRIDADHVVLEEFDLLAGTCDTWDQLAGRLATWISEDEEVRQEFRTRLILLDDDQFTHFVRHGTEVVARIGLDYERKTVRTGALFYQEYLPAETMLYSIVIASSARDGSGKSAGDVMNFLKSNIPPVLQFGGDETIGKGFCHVHFATDR